MYILGLNAYHADSAACIYKDGELLFAIEEERLRRIKHWAGFPSMAISECLKVAGIGIQQIDYITISRDPSANVLNKIKHVFSQSLFSGTKHLVQKITNRQQLSSIKALLANEFFVEESDIKAEIKNIEHHRSHLASAFFASPYQEAALLSIDGFGDFSSTMTGVGNSNKIEVLDNVLYPHSMGIFYTAFTQYLGFKNYGDEYKIMGLAPYGKPTYMKELEDVVKLTSDGFFKLNTEYFTHNKEGVLMSWDNGSPVIGDIFSDYLVEQFGPARKAKADLTEEHQNLAASVQKMTEEVILHILNHLHEKTQLDTVCIAGGVAQNSVANGKIYTYTPFKHVYIPPAATDAGTALGSALWFYHVDQKQARYMPMRNADWGNGFSNDEIKAELENNKVEYSEMSEEQIRELVTESLIQGGVVGWFKGKSELGPRALGFRSILADPRREDAKEILNLKIKKREPFRPFAPSILAEHAGDFFELSQDVPFMEKVYTIKPDKRKLLPAVTHVDGTGRLQTVKKETNPLYYELIQRFYEKTGVPIVLNTSFNENEPIVNTPKEALACFLRTKMDILVMENCVVIRKSDDAKS